MRAAGLRPIATILRSEAVLIQSSVTKHPHLEPLIQMITARIAGVVAAAQYVLCNYNILRDKLSLATSVTPGRRAPTVSPLEMEGWVAVSAMIERNGVASVLDKLTSVGAEDILIFKIDNSRG